MIRFEVSGATAEEFAENAMKAWGLMSIGLQAAVMQLRSQAADLHGATPLSPAVSVPSSPASSSTPKVVASDPVDDLFTQEVSATSEPKSGSKKSKAPKLDDLKTRLSEVLSAAAERWDVKRANAYARGLLAEFEVTKIGDLKPEKYDAFMDVSGEYLRGNVDEP